MNFFKHVIFFILLTLVVVSHTEASTSSGTIDSSSKITRICQDVSCSTFGQVNWKPTLNANTTGATAVSINDSAITGHIWGNQLGWINLAPTGAGVFVSPSTGVLSGMAFSSTGSWINFAPESVSGGTEVGVSINSSGEFVGWAWVSGAYGGWMKFDCTDSNTCIKTDWRPLSARESETISGTSRSSTRRPVESSSGTSSVSTIVLETPSFSYREEKPVGLVGYEYIQDETDQNGIGIVGGMSVLNKKGGEYREIFPRNADSYEVKTGCVFCLVLRKDLIGESSSSGYFFENNILKLAFVPENFEIRIPVSKILPFQDKIPFSIPDVDALSGTIVLGGFWTTGRFSLFLIRKLFTIFLK